MMETGTAFIGGIFIYSENPEALAEWYETTLGMKHEYTPEYSARYISYFYHDINTGQKAYTAWSILKSKGERPQSDFKSFTINLRVNNLLQLCENLKADGHAVKGPETHPEGHFAWLQDPDGNHLELWEDTTLSSEH